MILVEMAADSAPTRDLVDELARQLPGESTGSGSAATRWAVESRTPVLRVVPHPDDDACGYDPPTTHAAYSVRWSLPVLCQYRESGYAPGCEACASIREWEYLTKDGITPPAPADELVHTWWEDIAEVTTLRAKIVPAEQRLADLPEPDLSHLSPGQIRLLGGEEKAAQWAHRQQVVNVEHDRSATRYDWPRLAAALVELRTTLSAPRLTPLQRVAVAGVRVHLIEQDLTNARKSLAQLTRNARAATDPATGKPTAKKTIARYGGITRVTLDAYLSSSDTDD
ncbi:hypothetical protein ACFV1W_25280 [Kitasatospora sp. NPDC059648]|uniref:hypothetical protein n=1 Tax=Kitasatospora sp. NPDC059648 TaxID=3346894 RepID=UPI0036ADB079